MLNRATVEIIRCFISDLFQFYFNCARALLRLYTECTQTDDTSRHCVQLEMSILAHRTPRKKISGAVGGGVASWETRDPWKRWSKKLGVEFRPHGPCLCTLFLFSACFVYFHRGLRCGGLGRGRASEHIFP